jgi:predicted ArsR family transcriptional regulator
MAKCRRTDPVTSYQAAQTAEISGRAASHRAICLAQVNAHPGQTAAEIAFQSGLERHVPSRRLPELRERGLVINGKSRICTVTGRPSMIWLPAKGGAK